MPVGINQPSNQIKLTNVSLVRMKKGAQTSPEPHVLRKLTSHRQEALRNRMLQEQSPRVAQQD
ncbi:hypothetical protein IG631_01374 [Alternaria alternata]|jgi:hypothetical protein|nr:hypothetical protein IG631_01374 [Alternaria alternata]